MGIGGASDAVSWEVLSETTDRLPIVQYLKSTLKNYISHRKIGFLFFDDILWFTVFRVPILTLIMDYSFRQTD